MSFSQEFQTEMLEALKAMSKRLEWKEGDGPVTDEDQELGDWIDSLIAKAEGRE